MTWLGLTRDAWCAALALSPFAIAGAWGLYECVLRPRLVPGARIAELADAVIREHPEDPEAWARREEHAAWFSSHTFEQGQWRRVRELIRKRCLDENRDAGAERATHRRGSRAGACRLWRASHGMHARSIVNWIQAKRPAPMHPRASRPAPERGARPPLV